MYTMLIDPGNFVNSKIICGVGAVLCHVSLPCCTSPKELPVHLACVLTCTVVQKPGPNPAGLEIAGPTTRVCVYVGGGKLGTKEKKGSALRWLYCGAR